MKDLQLQDISVSGEEWYNSVKNTTTKWVHDGNNALNNIILATSQLQEEMEKQSDSKILFDIIDRNVQKILGMLQEVNYATTESNFKKKNQEFTNIFYELKAKYQGQDNVQFIGQIKGFCEADQEKLVEAIDCLIKNAIEESNQATVIFNDDKNNCYVKVINQCNHTVGNINKLILPFYTTKPEHKGIGLSMAYHFVKYLGGLLELKIDNKEFTASLAIPKK